MHESAKTGPITEGFSPDLFIPSSCPLSPSPQNPPCPAEVRAPSRLRRSANPPKLIELSPPTPGLSLSPHLRIGPPGRELRKSEDVCLCLCLSRGDVEAPSSCSTFSLPSRKISPAYVQVKKCGSWQLPGGLSLFLRAP